MKKSPPLLLVLFTLCFLFSLNLSARPLEPDSRIVSGKLSNGVHWMYRQHQNPPGKMALMLHMATGSLNETEEQRGLAHFLEHMCFNGTEHFAPGKLVPYFESIGMQFGADLNAFTSFDQTSYMLFTPDTKTEQIDKALEVLSDYAFRATLLQEEIDKERGVVLEESRARKSAEQRIRDVLWPQLFEGSLFARRLPIGDDKVIAGAPRVEFQAYYKKWYRPQNATVLLVGDRSPEGIGQLVEKWFGDTKGDAPPASKGPEFKAFVRERGIVVADSEMKGCNVQLMKVGAPRPLTTTTEKWRTELLESIGTTIMDRRFDEAVKKGTATYRAAGLSVGDFFKDGLLIGAEAEGEPADWQTMLTGLVAEVKRVQVYGFTPRELKLARQELIAKAEHAVEAEPTQSARGLIMAMLSSVNEKEPFLSAKQKLDLLREFLPTVELRELNGVFATHLKPGAFAYVLTTAEKGQTPSQDEVLKVAKAAWEQKVESVKEDASPTEILAALPKAGEVLEKTVDAGLGITSVWLSNGVRVHHRFMDYKKDQVYVSISLAGGEIEETSKNAGITQASLLVVNDAATKRLSSTQLRDLFIGKQVSVGASADGDAVTIQLSGSPADLEAGLQKVNAVLTEGIIEAAAFKNWKLAMLQQIEQWEISPKIRASAGLEDLLSGGDPRRTLITRERVDAQTLAGAQAWFDRLSREAPIEVAVVGDMPFDRAMALVSQYIGSLPKRERSAASLEALRNSTLPTGALSRKVEVKTITPQGMVLLGFVGSEGREIHESRVLQVAANILTSRLIKRVREDLSIVYSISASSTPGWVYRDEGRWTVSAPCDPGKVKQVVEEVSNILTEFVTKGPSAEEMVNARKQISNALDTSMREPAYWFSFMSHWNLHARELEAEKRKKAEYEAITAEETQKIFQKYHGGKRNFEVSAIPIPVAEGAATK